MKKPLYYTLMAIFCAIFLVCAGLLIRYAIRSGENSNEYGDLASRFNSYTNNSTRFIPTASSTPAATTWPPTGTTLPASSTTLPTLSTTLPSTYPPQTTLPTTGIPTVPPQTSPESTGTTAPAPTVPNTTAPSTTLTAPPAPSTTLTAPPAPSTTLTAPTAPLTTQTPSTALPVTTVLPTTTLPTTSWPPDPPNMMENMAMLYKENSHTVGWISIPGAGNYLSNGYPVMQTPNTAEWRDYYLSHSFDRRENGYGCIYAQEACDVFGPSDNITLYGHNMADGQMFGFLNNYDWKPQETYEKHKYIYFDTLYGCHTYEIFAIFRTSGTLGVGFAYHAFTNARSASEFDEFVATCRELSMIETSLVPRYGDKLLCLSTCSGRMVNGRLVVVAVRIA